MQAACAVNARRSLTGIRVWAYRRVVQTSGASQPDEAVIVRLRDLIRGADRAAVLASRALDDVAAVVAAAAASEPAAGIAGHGAGLAAAAELWGYRYRLLGDSG